MNYPPDSAMFFLLGIHLGDRVEIVDGELKLLCTGEGIEIDKAKRVRVAPEVLDALEYRDTPWIDCSGRNITITQSGAYWLERWAKSRMGRGRIVKVKLDLESVAATHETL